MKKSHLAILLIVTLAVLGYANSFGNAFVWDEQVFIVDNVNIRALENVPQFFGQTEFGLYRPLRTTWYAATYAVWKLEPFGYHLNSLAWHAAISALLFFLLRRLSSFRVALAASALFVVHPIHTERVTNMTGGFDLPGIFFLLLAFYAYVRFAQQGGKPWMALALVAFLLGLFSSEEVFTLPLLILLYEVMFNGFRMKLPQQKKTATTILLFLTILATFLLFRYFVIGAGARVTEYPGGAFGTTMLTMVTVIAQYALLSLFPLGTRLYREVDIVNTMTPALLLSLMLIAALLATAYVCRRRAPLLAFAVCWFFITLLPFMNILPLQTLMADRYLYLPSVSAVIVYALAVKKIAARNARASMAIAVLLVALFAGLTIDRNTDWKNDITLWSVTAETSPGTSVVFSNLGYAYERRGNDLEAKKHLLRAIALDHENARAQYNLGIVYLNNEKYDAAVRQFETAIAADRTFYKAYDGLGLAYYRQGAQSPNATVLLLQAKEALERGLAHNPAYDKAHADLGLVYGQMGMLAEAENELQTALHLNPWNAEAHHNLGVLYAFQGRDAEAQRLFAKAEALQP